MEQKTVMEQLVANICCASLFLPGNFLAHLSSYHLLWISGGKSACYQLHLPTGVREKSGVQPSRLSLSTRTEHVWMQTQWWLSRGCFRLNLNQFEYNSDWCQILPSVFYTKRLNFEPNAGETHVCSNNWILTEVCLPPEDWKASPGSTGPGSGWQSAHKCSVQQAKGMYTKTPWTICYAELFCMDKKLLRDNDRAVLICLLISLGNHSTSFQLHRQGVIVAHHDMFHKEQKRVGWAPATVSQICHAVHMHFNDNYLRFQVEISLLCRIIHFWSPQFPYYLQLAITSSGKEWVFQYDSSSVFLPLLCRLFLSLISHDQIILHCSVVLHCLPAPTADQSKLKRCSYVF